MKQAFKRKKNYWKLFLVFFIPLLLGAATFFYLDHPTGFFVREKPLLPEFQQNLLSTNFTLLDADPLDTTHFLLVDVKPVPGGILLSHNCTGVYIAMSNQKSFSIRRGLEKTLDIRPNYHDLTYDIIEHYGANITLAKITRVKNNFYYASLYLQQEGDLLELDSRPSDALALAARFQAPVYVHSSIFKKQGIHVCEA